MNLSGFFSRETAHETHAPKGHRHVAGGVNPRTGRPDSIGSSPGGVTGPVESRRAMWEFPPWIRYEPMGRSWMTSGCRPFGAGGELTSSRVRGLSPPATCLGPSGAATRVVRLLYRNDQRGSNPSCRLGWKASSRLCRKRSPPMSLSMRNIPYNDSQQRPIETPTL
jgi:hypothetical protein